MKVIIAGSRFASYEDVLDAIATCPFRDQISVVVSGKAPGADTHGETWADANGVPVDPHPAKWNDLTTPGAIPIKRTDGTYYNKRAGTDRNREMAEVGDALIAAWDGRYRSGTMNMINLAKERGLRVHVYHYLDREVVNAT